jgi:hypothetical protein
LKWKHLHVLAYYPDNWVNFLLNSFFMWLPWILQCNVRTKISHRGWQGECLAALIWGFQYIVTMLGAFPSHFPHVVLWVCAWLLTFS